MERLLVILIAIIISGCATVYPECEKHPEESEERQECQTAVREWRQGIDAENWRLCEKVLQSQGKWVFSDHGHGRSDRHQPQEIKSDLAKNGCRMVLREHWANY